ncbi:tetratricopeptide repeat protein [Hyphomicrobiales bacterium]|nr:tetratricopeptide repeat protein [Hyphomicrobiales bacterium]
MEIVNPSQEDLNKLLKQYQNKQYKEAEKLALLITKEFKEHQFSWKILGSILSQTGRKPEAVFINQRAVHLAPHDIEAIFNLGNTLQDLNRPEEAEVNYKKALDIKPDFAECHGNLGNVLRILGKQNEALDSYKKAIQLKPDYVQAHYNLATLLSEINKLEEAESSFKKAIILNPEYYQAHYSLGLNYQLLGRLNDSEESFKKAILLKPDSAEVHNNLGVIFKQQGRLEEAEEKYRESIALKSNFEDPYSNLGLILKEMDRLEEAEEILRKALTINPNNADIYTNIGVTLQELGRLEESISFHKQAISLNPGQAKIYNNIGATYQLLGSLEKADENYIKAIGIEPNNIGALMNRWHLLFEKKDFETALKVADKCNSEISRLRSLVTLFALGRTEEIYERIAMQSKVDDTNLRVAAFAAFIASKEKKDTAHNFCKNPLDFLYFSNLSSYFIDTNLFITNVIEELDDIKTVWEPYNKTTSKGFQTPHNHNLFANPSEKMAELKSVIIKELDLYYLKFKDESCSYIKNWPDEKNIFGWHVILKHQGQQTSHIHPSGWLSGVIYLKVVPPLGRDEGAIEFSLDGKNYNDINSPKLIHQPKEGDIVFFPSSLHHNTVPFTTNTDRIIVSFDLLPVGTKTYIN